MTDHHVCSDAAFLSSLEDYQLIPHLVRALAEGRPVRVEELAASANLPVGDVERLLRSQPGTEWDEAGLLVGFGLTTRPTAHRFQVDATALYTWCATDTLLFTVILGQPSIIDSTCPATGQSIQIELDPHAVISVRPEEAVVSQRHHGELLSDVRSQVCDQGHFFASPTAASTWSAEYPEGEVLRVAEAFGHCRQACQELGWLPEPSYR
ncbi:MAG: organomercurial lyase MerB [Candidatus Dormibacterales bacterium]